MQKLIDIFIFTVFAVGGFLLANLVEITIPLILLLAVLLSIQYWKTRRRVLAYFCGIYAIFLAMFWLVFLISIAGLSLASHQWEEIKAQHPGTKDEVESHIFWARTVRSSAFTELYMSIFFTRDIKDQSWHDSNQRVYAPAEGDKFYAYKVIGFLPIDVIYDRNDNIKMAFNSFDY